MIPIPIGDYHPRPCHGRRFSGSSAVPGLPSPACQRGNTNVLTALQLFVPRLRPDACSLTAAASLQPLSLSPFGWLRGMLTVHRKQTVSSRALTNNRP